MKKIVLAAVLALTGMACAQAEDTFAPKQGTISTEIKFSPFRDNGEVFSMPALSVSYYFTNRDAFLVELGLNGENHKYVADTDADESFEKWYQGTFSINLGYQRHFYQYKRIDLYAGGKVGYIHKFAGHKDQSTDNNYEWGNYYKDYRTGNGFSIYATTGINFYIYKGLYVGAELNLGFEDVLASNTKTKTVTNGKETEVKSKTGGHDFLGGFNVDPKIRLGWSF